MKTLPIIAIVTIVVISTTSFGIFIGKVNDSKQSYLIVTVNGMKENYTINEPISFAVTLEGYGTGCGDTKAEITKENDTQFQPLVWASEPYCVSNPDLHNFKFNSLSANTRINQTGNYILAVRFDDLIAHHTTGRNFSVILPDNASTYDAGTAMSTNVTNTHFKVNYDVVGAKVLEIKLNKQSGALEISLMTAGKGVLTVDLPRELINAKVGYGDTQFIVLADGQEIAYNETRKTIQDRELSIPFPRGIEKIEIIGTYPV